MKINNVKPVPNMKHPKIANIASISEKKAQIKIQETAFVLLAIVFLFSLIALFYFKFYSIDITKKALALKEERALSMLDKIIGMPEISCSSYIGAKTESLCIDKDKLEILPSMKGYENIWKGVKGIMVMQLYPSKHEFAVYSSGEEEKQEYSTFANLCEQESLGYKCTIAMVLIAI